MKRLAEIVKNIVTRESVVQRFAREVAPGSETGFDVFLKKGVEYVVRGESSRGPGSLRLSLSEKAGAVAPVYADRKDTFLSLIPEKDGVYRIKAAATGTGPLSVKVVLSKVTTPNTFSLEPYTATPYWMERAPVAGSQEDPCGEVEYRQSKAS